MSETASLSAVNQLRAEVDQLRDIVKQLYAAMLPRVPFPPVVNGGGPPPSNPVSSPVAPSGADPA
jgi:hypothetical protein